MNQPSLPSVLPSGPALQDILSTPQQIAQTLARATNPLETPIFICALQQCYRLFPNRERLMTHRKRDHHSEEEGHIITWND